MSARFGPQRRFRGEIAALAVVVAVPIALVLVFPCAALRGLPPPAVQGKDVRFVVVSLTPEEERSVIASARAAWQMDTSRGRHMRIGLLPESIPEFKVCESADPGLRPRVDRLARANYIPDLRPPTLAAPPPAILPVQADSDLDGPVFSREELLKLK